MKSKEIMQLIQYYLVSYQQDFGIYPNIVILSKDILSKLQSETVMKLSDDDKITVYGIEIEIEMNKKEYIKVGYIR